MASSIVLAVAALVAMSCGTRVEDPEARALTGSSSVVSTAPGVAETPPTSADVAVEQQAAAAAGSGQQVSPSAPRGLSSSKPSSKTGQAETPAPSRTQAASRGNAAPGTKPGAAAAPGATQVAPPGSATPAPATGSTHKSPLLIASIGHFSGVFGNTCVPFLQGLQTWVSSINARGGLKGHEVKLFVYDDGVDPAKHRAQVQEAVEHRHVQAFVMTCAPFTQRPSTEYIEKHRVPVIGMTGSEPWAYESPMLFPQLSSGDYFWAASPAATARLLVPKGKKNVGTLVCIEGSVCDDAARVWDQRSPGLGLKIVFKEEVSTAQPDYTAQCLAARNAGVEIMFVLLTSPAIGSVVKACARQGFKPTYVIVAQGLGAPTEQESFDGTLATSLVFPWFTSGTPATDEFHQAYGTYRGGTVPYSAPFGWVAAKLLERAAQNLPEPPTSAALLAGLWTMRDDTLGGLTSPLTFIENKPAKPTLCWFDLLNTKGKWASPDGAQLHCA